MGSGNTNNNTTTNSNNTTKTVGDVKGMNNSLRLWLVKPYDPDSNIFFPKLETAGM